MNIRYIGPAKDYSGYGEAVRHDIAALLDAGIKITGVFPRYTPEIADFGILAEKLQTVENINLPYDITILHTTPNVYTKYMEIGKYHIARVFWETDKLPAEFAVNIQACDEIWTGSEFNAAAIRNSGITKPIYIIPEAIDTNYKPGSIEPYLLNMPESFKFYSIFEWTERKNPAALLAAYWQEFEKDTDVSLSIKTYVDNFSKDKRREIDDFVIRMKSQLALSRYAPVYLYRNLMDRTQIYRFHETFDCFVSAHRGEGWGIPQMEAMLCENPVISTNLGGIHEYLKNGIDALLVDYSLINLDGNSRNQQWYTPDQLWANVDIADLRRKMRLVYRQKQVAKEMGITGGKLVRQQFSFTAVGEKMLDRLETIPYPKS